MSAELHRRRTVRVERHVSGGLANNAYLLVCRRTGAAVAVDAPRSPRALIAAARGVELRAVLITHGHHDHEEGYGELVAGNPLPTWLGAGDRAALAEREPAWLEPGADGSLRFGEIALQPLATPGHTPGSTCFLLPPTDPGDAPLLFSGDTLFPGGPGRTWSHRDLKTILASLAEHLFTLPPDTVVLPGHGRPTTIADEAEGFRKLAAKQLEGDEMGDVSWG